MSEQNKNTRIISSLLIALGIFAAGLALRGGIVRFKSMERVVTVKGLAEKEVPADKAVWRLSFSQSGDDMLSLYSIVESNNSVLKKYLIENGLNENEIFLSSPNLTNNEDQYSYRSEKPRYKYSIYSSMTVSSKSVEAIRKLDSEIVSSMLKKGIIVSSYVNYDFTGLSDIKPAMIEEATKNARAAAQKFAEDSKSKIGKIKTASQGQFSVYDLDETTPYIKNVRVVTTVVYYLD